LEVALGFKGIQTNKRRRLLIENQTDESNRRSTHSPKIGLRNEEERVIVVNINSTQKAFSEFSSGEI
jgi:hypothetical protein